MNATTKTTAKTIGLCNGYQARYRQAGCSAKDFLSTSCNRFEMPPQKRSSRTAGTRTATRQDRRQQFDERIIARWPRLVKVVEYIVIALTFSGILPMALAEFQIWLIDVYGIVAFVLCMASDAALAVWLVRLERLRGHEY